MTMYWVPANVDFPLVQPVNIAYDATNPGIPPKPIETLSWSTQDLTAQLESLLSKESMLSNMDPFISCLILQLGSFDIPAACLAAHPNLSPVTPTELIEAASASKILVVDKERQLISPELKPKRSTLILRDVHPDVTAADILKLLESYEEFALFSNEDTPSPETNNGETLQDSTTQKPHHIPQIQSLIFGGNQCWFLTLSDQELTQKVALWMKTQKLKDNTIHVRMKTEVPLSLNQISRTITPCIPQPFLHFPHLRQERSFQARPAYPFKQRDGKPNYSKQKSRYKSKTQQPFVQKLCVFCQRKKNNPTPSGLKPNVNQNNHETTNSTTNHSAEQKESRCLCRLLHNVSKHNLRFIKPGNGTPLRKRSDASYPKNFKSQKRPTPHTEKQQFNRWGSNKFEAQKLQRTAKINTKSCVANVVQIEKSPKKKPCRFKVSSSTHRKKNSTYDFPSLDEFMQTNIAKLDKEPTASKGLTQEQPSWPSTSSNGGDTPPDVEATASSGTVDDMTRMSDLPGKRVDIPEPKTSDKTKNRQTINPKLFWMQKTSGNKTKQQENKKDKCQEEAPLHDSCTQEFPTNLSTHNKKNNCSSPSNPTIETFTTTSTETLIKQHPSSSQLSNKQPDNCCNPTIDPSSDNSTSIS